MSGGSHNYISYAINGALFKDRFENRIDNHYKNVCEDRITVEELKAINKQCEELGWKK